MIDGSGVGVFGGGVMDLDEFDFFELAFETVVIEEDDDEAIEGDGESALFSIFVIQTHSLTIILSTSHKYL